MKKSAATLSASTVLLIGLLGPAIAETVYIPEILTHYGLITTLYKKVVGEKTSSWSWYPPELSEQACIEAIGRNVEGHWDEVDDWKCAKAFTNVPH